MIWLILFVPTVLIWLIIVFTHIKYGKGNQHYHEPLIFHSQRMSPFPIKNITTTPKEKTEKSYRKR
ncbi:DNA recombination protein RecO [Bacillus cereus]|uniref:DNA recombination protein RecO n=1 Tax=Bacillus cereus TaxID=1396 RepID=A0A2A8UN00_BACCE|nr:MULTISPECIES: DNA recombination protein RecO [Bacillus cereus group]PFA24280.1 DNA recombination protein RecO [Bacillus cereus]PFK45993.1 DNA recombination protein RecO [Bacillus cereus]PFN08291.1 DNA recombination protein RecO [Bacillus cereus]PFO81626.1 DNA recombination protein RecO [Bacillus cereus]PFS02679.1 DNA recombination protein RecO [Bacillus cereus]